MSSAIVDRTMAFADWRAAARRLLTQGATPRSVAWQMLDDAPSLFNSGDRELSLPGAQATPSPTVPKPFLALAETVCCHADASCFALLYLLLWRLQTEPHLLDKVQDEDVHAAVMMQKSVHRDTHKMKAFLRFRELPKEGATARRAFVAWFEPDHFIIRTVAPFFARRFADMDWTILTPRGSVGFEAGALTFGPPAAKPALPDDASAELWNTYFSNIFNPARLKVKSMQSHMPKKYWRNMPETNLIPDLIATAAERATRMQEHAPSMPSEVSRRIKAREFVPEQESGVRASTLQALHADVRVCRRCPLHCHATQAVCGEGSETAQLMFIGEQPGDKEDLSGRPFIGPAGEVLDEALQNAGIEHSALYMTNAVKHFKFKPQGKRRIHERANMAEISHCRWWLDQETELVKPKLIVCLGSTAALSVTGSGEKLLQRRGKVEPSRFGIPALITLHPSAILRMPNKHAADELRSQLTDDIALARQLATDSQ